MPQHPEPPAPWFDPVEEKIREARDRGEFDNLPGAGKPIADLDRTYDPGWWAKRYLEKMKAEDAAVELKRQIDRELPHLRVSADRAAALARVEEWNAAVDEINASLKPHEQMRSVEL